MAWKPSLARGLYNTIKVYSERTFICGFGARTDAQPVMYLGVNCSADIWNCDVSVILLKSKTFEICTDAGDGRKHI